MARWLAINTLKTGWQRFWQDCRRVPNEAWRRWAGTLALGLGICAILMLAMTIAVKSHLEQGVQAWDARMLPILAERLPLNFPRAVTWESPGNLLGMVPVVCVFIGITVARSQPLLTATMMMAYGLQFALVWIGWGYWNRGRPDTIADGVAASGLHSFPSGHTVVVITVYGLLAYLWCAASPSWSERLFAIVVTVFWLSMIISSRLVLGAHWPSDVVVSIVMGILWLIVVITALHRVRKFWGD